MTSPEEQLLREIFGKPAPAARCDYSDLLVENCGHCQGTPELWEGPSDKDALPEQIEGTWAIATYNGECGCGCNLRVSQGDEIVLAKVGDSEDWVLLEHASSPRWVADHFQQDR